MKISKTLFKNLMRCPNFASILDMYRNRGAHSVKLISGFSNQEINEGINNLESVEIDSIFSEQSEEIIEVFSHLFDEETGEDLTEVTSAQLEAFSDTFVEVERLAMEQAKTMFEGELIASTDTFKQKMFSYVEEGHTFYCYLDGYIEENNSIKVFEVKSTTSKEFNDICLSIRKSKNCSGAKLPLFIKDNSGIMQYVGDSYIGQKIDQHEVTLEELTKTKKKLYSPYSHCGKYIYDLAIERYFIEHSILQSGVEALPKIEYYLVILNSDYIYDGYEENGEKVYRTSSDGERLFKFYNLTTLTAELQEDVNQKQRNIFRYLDELTLANNRLSISCEFKKTTQCKFNKVCFNCVLKDGSILEYLGRHYAFKSLVVDEKGKQRTLSIYEMINDGHYMIDDCRDYITKIDNIIQYDCYTQNMEYLDKPRILASLKAIQYPIYHLDFESYNCPLPRFFGEKPYTQSLFQYSLHKEVSPGVCDIVKNHTEYLAPDHQDHREDLIKSLINDIDLSNGGCVMVYNQNFEKTRLHELAAIFPKYKKELDNINDHIYDLLFVLKGNKKFFENILDPVELEELENKPQYAYYNNKLHGSFSIKKVLPIFTNLTYKTLEVKNGTEAILTYGMLPKLTEEEYQKKYLALRIYCRQDTWAMVEILRGLRKAFQ